MYVIKTNATFEKKNDNNASTSRVRRQRTRRETSLCFGLFVISFTFAPMKLP